MRVAALFCVLATAHAWKPPKTSLLEKPLRKCEMPKNFKRLPTQQNDTKGRRSQRLPTELELKEKDYLAEPYLHTIYFINLDKSEDRAKHMEKQLNSSMWSEQLNRPKYHYERFAAKNRSDAKMMDRKKYSVNTRSEHPGMGTVATYLSHWHALEKIATHPDKNAVFIVLEDDARLPDNWADEVMCQVKQLPADWDLFKFGYWPLPGARWAGDRTCSGSIRQKEYNEYTCNQRSFALEWMGNLGYAVRPNGAKTTLEHLREVPVMDVDGAMMPGCCIKNSTNVAQNVYVSRHSVIHHGNFGSVRLSNKLKVISTTSDLRTLSNDDDRETSYEAYIRLSEAFKRGELAEYEDNSVDEPKNTVNYREVEVEVDNSKDQDKVTSLAGLGA